MDAERYRAYLVRVWFRGDRGRGVARLVVEDVRSGACREMRGPRAGDLSARLEEALVGGVAVRTLPGDPPSGPRTDGPTALSARLPDRGG